METFSSTISVPNGVAVLHVDGRHLRILDEHEQKCKLSLRACEGRCNQFEEHLLNGCTGDTPNVTYNRVIQRSPCGICGGQIQMTPITSVFPPRIILPVLHGHSSPTEE